MSLLTSLLHHVDTRRLYDLYRLLHSTPELAFEESSTLDVIAQVLHDVPASPWRTRRGRGLIAELGDVTSADSVLTLRAPIDGLPLDEQTGVSFSSRNAGVMHACGHDVNTAALLAIADALVAVPVPSAVRLVFQPAEETLEGARALLTDGSICLRPNDTVIGFHLTPRLPVGNVGFSFGTLFAGAYDFDVHIRGSGGHASSQSVSSVVGALAEGLSNMLSRYHALRADFAGVGLVLGHISAGAARNIVATFGEVQGTVRAHERADAERLLTDFEMCFATAGRAHNATCTFSWDESVPPLRCDEDVAHMVKRGLTAALPAERVVEIEPSLASDDASLMIDAACGAYWLVGCGPADGSNGPALHTATFLPADGTLNVAVASCAGVIASYFVAEMQ